jgi:tartrate dehydratase beta subunit/fumarate hydratase class I family protein
LRATGRISVERDGAFVRLTVECEAGERLPPSVRHRKRDHADVHITPPRRWVNVMAFYERRPPARGGRTDGS